MDGEASQRLIESGFHFNRRVRHDRAPSITKMLIQSLSPLEPRDIPNGVWARLEAFKNVDLVKKKLITLQEIPEQHHHNAQKQARQIRFCIQQAREYYDSAILTSLVTRPVHLYYCIMCLALSEILLKQSGESSLDKARQEHRHHGLIFSLRASSSKDILSHLSYLRASPMQTANGRRGTFELWHRSARHLPLVGRFQSDFQTGLVQESPSILLSESDNKLPELPDSGITFLDCVTHIPAMSAVLAEYGIRLRLARGKMVRRYREKDNSLQDTLTVQPNAAELIQSIKHRILFSPRASSDDINIMEKGPRDGFVMTHRYLANQTSGYIDFPNAFNIDTSELYFMGEEIPLNEFGFFYVGLFLCGMFARYYPDKWIPEYESSGVLFQIIDRFFDIAIKRVPTLAVSELSRSYYLEKAVI